MLVTFAEKLRLLFVVDDVDAEPQRSRCRAFADSDRGRCRCGCCSRRRPLPSFCIHANGRQLACTDPMRRWLWFWLTSWKISDGT